jgi:hypothetical protein
MTGTAAEFFAESTGLSPAELSARLTAGGRIVRFEYCISLVVATLRRESGPVVLRPRQWAWLRGMPFSLISVACGWWGIPWGIILTPLTLWANMCGGRDISSQVRESISRPDPL